MSSHELHGGQVVPRDPRTVRREELQDAGAPAPAMTDIALERQPADVGPGESASVPVVSGSPAAHVQAFGRAESARIMARRAARSRQPPSGRKVSHDEMLMTLRGPGASPGIGKNPLAVSGLDSVDLADHVAALIEASKDRVWTHEVQEIAKRTANQLQQLYSARLAGKDVDRDMVHVLGSAKRIAVASTLNGSRLFSESIKGWLSALVQKAVTGLL